MRHPYAAFALAATTLFGNAARADEPSERMRDAASDEPSERMRDAASDEPSERMRTAVRRTSPRSAVDELRAWRREAEAEEAAEPEGGDDTSERLRAAESARAHFVEALAALERGDHRLAVRHLAVTERVEPTPRVERMLAESYEALGEGKIAAAYYRLYLDDLPAAPDRAAVVARVRRLGDVPPDEGPPRFTVPETPEPPRSRPRYVIHFIDAESERPHVVVGRASCRIPCDLRLTAGSHAIYIVEDPGFRATVDVPAADATVVLRRGTRGDIVGITFSAFGGGLHVLALGMYLAGRGSGTATPTLDVAAVVVALMGFGFGVPGALTLATKRDDAAWLLEDDARPTARAPVPLRRAVGLGIAPIPRGAAGLLTLTF